MTSGFDAMMARLVLMYGDPPVPKESFAAFTTEWRRALGGYADDILREATDRLSGHGGIARGQRLAT
jgi:hypothetical protein